MEAKDTVMKGFDGIVLEALENQADISFKAGQEDKEQEWVGKLNELKDATAISFKEQHKAGIREVVAWVEEHEQSTCMDCSCAFDFRSEEWKAQLKEWGMK